MRISEALLNESIVDDIQNSLVRGVVPEQGPGTPNYNILIGDFKDIAKRAKQAFPKPDGKVDNAKVVWFLRWYVLDTKIRPAVARDGGDIKFKSFDNGVVKVELQGSCSGCPSSLMTLKQGVQNLLKHYVKEVNSVEAN